MTELSPAAQAVLNAADGVCMYRPDRDDTRLAAAAALRAAVDFVVPEENAMPVNLAHRVRWDAEQSVRLRLLAIASELETQ